MARQTFALLSQRNKEEHMNTVEDSVALLVKTGEAMTTYRKSLEVWRSAMTDLAILHSLQTMTEQQEDYDIQTVFTPEVLMAWIIRDRWQPVSIDEDGYEGIDNAVRAYLIDSKLAIDPHHMEEEDDD
jgi:hypothetical protein